MMSLSDQNWKTGKFKLIWRACKQEGRKEEKKSALGRGRFFCGPIAGYCWCWGGVCGCWLLPWRMRCSWACSI